MDYLGRILQLRDKANLKSTELARLAGIPQPKFSKLENGIKKPDLEIIEAICKALGITLKEFFNDESDPIPLTSELRELIDNAKELNTEQIKKLNEFIQSVRVVKKTLTDGTKLEYAQAPGGKKLTEEEEIAIHEYFKNKKLQE